ncbi:MAG: glycine betaine ABC transporter substrate-binding protein, partial [Sphingomonas sp.]
AREKHGVTLLGGMGFENAYAFAMRGEDAEARGIKSLIDLAKQAPQLDLATDVEFLERPEWRAVRDAYGLRFRSAHPYQPTFMYKALAGGEADVIPAFSSDGRIAADRLTVLADPKGAIPGYDAILLLSPKRAEDARFQAALRPLIGAIRVEDMREANYRVDRDSDKVSPGAAANWLASHLQR